MEASGTGTTSGEHCVQFIDISSGETQDRLGGGIMEIMSARVAPTYAQGSWVLFPHFGTDGQLHGVLSCLIGGHDLSLYTDLLTEISLSFSIVLKHVRSENMAQDHRDTLQSTLDALEDAVLLTNASGKVIHVSSSSWAVLGLQRPDDGGHSMLLSVEDVGEMRRPASCVLPCSPHFAPRTGSLLARCPQSLKFVSFAPLLVAFAAWQV